MFMLQRDLLTQVTLQGQVYELDLSFDNILNLRMMLADKELDWDVKTDTSLELLIENTLDHLDYETKVGVLNSILKQVFGVGETKAKRVDILGQEMPDRDEDERDNDKVDYCLYEDAKYIYASFLQCYGIDLLEERGSMHWDVFNALLVGLSKDTKFMEVLEIRGRELPTGKGKQKERQEVIRLQRKYKLKGTYSHL